MGRARWRRVFIVGVVAFNSAGPAVFAFGAHEPESSAPSTGQQPKRTKLKNRKPVESEVVAPATTVPGPGAAPSAATLSGVVTPPQADSAAQGWSVVVAVFRGEDQEAEARALVGRVRTEGGLPEAYAQKRAQATVIAVGNFEGRDEARAEELLHRVQAIEAGVGGQRPYTGAYLAPPPSTPAPGRLPQYNLLRAKDQAGEKALYTLQVGVYGRDDLEHPGERDLGEARRAAEQAAVTLRQEGEQAFYFHGPRRSMVTVGVFDAGDFDPQAPQFKSSRLREAQKRFPYNLYNGAGVREKRKGDGQARLQPSNLVAIPKG